MVVGLDWPSVEVLLPRDVEREPVIELLKEFEAGALAGMAEKSKERRG